MASTRSDKTASTATDRKGCRRTMSSQPGHRPSPLAALTANPSGTDKTNTASAVTMVIQYRGRRLAIVNHLLRCVSQRSTCGSKQGSCRRRFHRLLLNATATLYRKPTAWHNASVHAAAFLGNRPGSDETAFRDA